MTVTTMSNRQRMRDRHVSRDWHDHRAAEAEAAARVLGPCRAFLPLGDDFTATQPAECCGPCDQGRRLCPCPAACGLVEDEPRNSKPLHQYALDALADIPAGFGIGAGIVAAIVVAALIWHRLVQG